MEGGALVAETMLAGGELAEVLRRLRDNVIIELEDDAAGVGVVDGDIELEIITTSSVNRERAITATLGRESGQRQDLTSVEMGRGDNTGALPLHDYLVLLLIIHRAYARSELHHFCGRAEAADACEGPAAPDPAGARDKLRTVQREQGLGGPEQDGWLVSSYAQSFRSMSDG